MLGTKSIRVKLQSQRPISWDDPMFAAIPLSWDVRPTGPLWSSPSLKPSSLLADLAYTAPASRFPAQDSLSATYSKQTCSYQCRALFPSGVANLAAMDPKNTLMVCWLASLFIHECAGSPRPRPGIPRLKCRVVSCVLQPLSLV